MAGILVYALHDDEGNFNKNSLGAISEAAKLAAEIGGECSALVVGGVADDAAVARGAEAASLAAEIGGECSALVVGDVADDAAAGLGKYCAAKVYRAKS